MRGLTLCHAALAAAACLLGACNESGPEAGLVPPPDYSPHYTHVAVMNEAGKTRRVLVPEACLAAERQSPADTGDPRLPPGCANAFNLQRMAERKRDLTQGRPLGPAPAAPATRAAQKYLDGRDTPALGGAFRDDKDVGITGTGSAATTTASPHY